MTSAARPTTSARSCAPTGNDFAVELLGCFLLFSAIFMLIIALAIAAASPAVGVPVIVCFAALIWFIWRSARKKVEKSVETSVRHYGRSTRDRDEG